MGKYNLKLLKDILRVAFSNIISFGSSFIVGFILPAILTVADYGRYQQFTLYLSVIYIFNFGFNDGIYRKYGGKELTELSKKEVQSEHNFISLFHLIEGIILLAITIPTQDPVLIVLSFLVYFYSIITYHNNFLRAIGEFNRDSTGTIIRSIVYILLLLFAIFVINSENYIVYISMLALSYVVTFFYYEIMYIKKYGFNLSFSLDGKFNLFKVGFVLLISNMSITFVANAGRWIVEWFFPIEVFAQYSFQNSVLNVVLLIVNAVGMVFYNLIAKYRNHGIYKMISKASLLLGIFSGVAFFIFDWIISTFISNYTSAIPLLAATFISIPFIMISKILIANLYKSQEDEKIYFRDSILFALGSFILVFLAYLVFRDIFYIALATSVCYILWYLYCSQVRFKFIKGGLKEILILSSFIIVFSFTAFISNNILGLIIYIIYLIVLTFFLRDDIKNIAGTLIGNKQN